MEKACTNPQCNALEFKKKPNTNETKTVCKWRTATARSLSEPSQTSTTRRRFIEDCRMRHRALHQQKTQRRDIRLQQLRATMHPLRLTRLPQKPATEFWVLAGPHLGTRPQGQIAKFCCTAYEPK